MSMDKDQALEVHKIIVRMWSKEQTLDMYPDNFEGTTREDRCNALCPFGNGVHDYCTRSKGHSGYHVDYHPVRDMTIYPYLIWAND